jgi:hypothetical protein
VLYYEKKSHSLGGGRANLHDKYKRADLILTQKNPYLPKMIACGCTDQ